jgi:hypothetical protein
MAWENLRLSKSINDIKQPDNRRNGRITGTSWLYHRYSPDEQLSIIMEELKHIKITYAINVKVISICFILHI